jgi:putative transcriptional regulator
LDIEDISTGYLTGQLLIAMPQMLDTRFERSVIYICVHNEDGAMGLVVNQLASEFTFADLLQQLEIDAGDAAGGIPVYIGGPVESGRGFVLHTSDYTQGGTITVNSEICLTATIDILKDIAAGAGPHRSLLALGYSGWDAGQLDDEIQKNSWLNVAADDALLFGGDLEHKWERSIAKLGVDVSLLSGEAGHA